MTDTPQIATPADLREIAWFCGRWMTDLAPMRRTLALADVIERIEHDILLADVLQHFHAGTIVRTDLSRKCVDVVVEALTELIPALRPPGEGDLDTLLPETP